MKKIFYVDANCAKGYVSLLEENFEKGEDIVLFKSLTKKAGEIVFGKIIEKAESEKRQYSVFLSCGERYNIIGIKKGKSIFLNYDYAKNKEGKIIDFSDCYGDFPDNEKNEELIEKEQKEKDKMYAELKNAKIIHDEWEKIYIENMDFDVLSKKTDELIYDIFKKTFVKNRTGKNEKGFFGTLLPKGNINYIDELTNNIKRRIFIKGRPGTGKSTILKKIRREALERGFDTESFYCSLDPKSLDMLIIRSLGVAVFDSTSPHEMEPLKEGDEIFDVYLMATKKDTDVIYEKELDEIKVRYDKAIKKAKLHLEMAEFYKEEQEKILTSSLDYKRFAYIINEVMELA